MRTNQLEVAKAAYLWLPFLTFGYLSLPLVFIEIRVCNFDALCYQLLKFFLFCDGAMDLFHNLKHRNSQIK